MNNTNVLITPLSKFHTPGGDVLHGIKSIDKGYSGFGEVYFSWITHRSIKAWKRHLNMTLNLIVPIGHVRFVFYDDHSSSDSNFEVYDVGLDNYVRLTVPPGLWFGFQGLSLAPSLVANVANIPHDPDELERLLLSEISYPWSKL